MSKILIVEDDPFLSKAYINVLTKEGFEVEHASTGVEALEKAAANEPNLIILDMLMPQMDGPEFLKQYDVKTKHPNVKVIVFSNMSIAEKVNEAIELGASNYKTKAFFSPREMVQLIRDTLAGATIQPSETNDTPETPAK
jgi:two-component system, OmpR family, response regulator ResD